MARPEPKSDLEEAGWDQLPNANNWIESIDQAILRLTVTSALEPIERLNIDGNDTTVEAVLLPPGVAEDDPNALPAFRMVRKQPLEALYYTAKNPIHLYQYLAGLRYRMDWETSQMSPMSAIDYSQSAMFVTKAMQEQSVGYRVGIDGPAMASALRSVKQTPDNKLDAMARIGDAIDAVPARSAWFARRFIAEERSIGWCARRLGIDERRAGGNIRDMLDDFARHYKMIAAARQRRK